MRSWDRATIATALSEREADLTTWGRHSGKPARITLWVWGDEQRLFIRSGGGLGRDWPQNLLAHGRGILHLAGQDFPVRARHVTDPDEARACTALAMAKYGASIARSTEDSALTPGETATFELTPAPTGASS